MLHVTTLPDITEHYVPQWIETVAGASSAPPQFKFSFPTFGIEALQRENPERALKQSAAVTWEDALQKNFAALRALVAGWDGPGSLPVDRNLLYIADRILRDALEGVSQARAPYVVPIRDGSIQLEWHSARNDFEIVLSADTPVYAWLRDRITNTEIDGEGEQASDLIFRWTRRIAAPAGDDNIVADPPAQGPLLLAA